MGNSFLLYLHLFETKQNLSNERWFLLTWMGVFTLRVSMDWIKRAFPFWKFAFAILSLPRGKLEQNPFYDENSTNNSPPYLPESRMFFKHSLKLFLFLSSPTFETLLCLVSFGDELHSKSRRQKTCICWTNIYITEADLQRAIVIEIPRGLTFMLRRMC